MVVVVVVVVVMMHTSNFTIGQVGAWRGASGSGQEVWLAIVVARVVHHWYRLVVQVHFPPHHPVRGGHPLTRAQLEGEQSVQ